MQEDIKDLENVIVNKPKIYKLINKVNCEEIYKLETGKDPYIENDDPSQDIWRSPSTDYISWLEDNAEQYLLMRIHSEKMLKNKNNI